MITHLENQTFEKIALVAAFVPLFLAWAAHDVLHLLDLSGWVVLCTGIGLMGWNIQRTQQGNRTSTVVVLLSAPFFVTGLGKVLGADVPVYTMTFLIVVSVAVIRSLPSGEMR